MTYYLHNSVNASNISNEPVTVYVSSCRSGEKYLRSGSSKEITPVHNCYELNGVSPMLHITVTYHNSEKTLTKNTRNYGYIIIENDRVYMRDDITDDLKKCTIL